MINSSLELRRVPRRGGSSVVIIRPKLVHRMGGNAVFKRMKRREWLIGGAFATAIAALGVSQAVLDNKAEAQRAEMIDAPVFEVDPFWPKPLPNGWLLGSAIGVWVDEQDHVWMIHRSSATLNDNEKGAELTPPRAECCRGAPPVLVFDQEGNLVRSWGGPGQGYEWPQSNHGITVDHKGNVWIGGNGQNDAHILKFTKDGKFLAQYGGSGKNAGSNNPENFGRVAKIWIDALTNEAYVSDGYLNKRVAVLDADTGKLKRYWGAYGNRPDDTNLGPYNPDAPQLAQQFRNPVHCAERAVDGMVYVCDRPNNRLQVFTQEGKFVKEAQFAKRTLGAGSTWDLAFTKDPLQRFILLVDGQNERIRILDRQTLEELTSFGDGGRQPGQFYGVHSIALDSRGNMFVTETYEGKRIQRFIYKGIQKTARGYQGVPWPKRG